MTPPPTTQTELLRSYSKTIHKRWIIIALLFALALIVFLVAVAVGPMNYSFSTVIKGIARSSQVDSKTITVIWSLRLPMAVMALLIGMALALAGAQMQTILGNPLAEPFTLGISSAAAFGGASSVVLGWTLSSQMQVNLALCSWITAMLATGFVVLLAVIKGASAQTMILVGIGISFFFQALLSLVQYKASAEALQQIVFWTMGSLTNASWTGNGIILAALLISLPIFSVLSWKLTALRLGDERAMSMGVNVGKLRIIVLILVSMLAATTVAFAGVIGFVGLIGPHIARMLVGEDQKFFIPASMATGAFVLCAAHCLSILIGGGRAIPIGIITALFGVPFFMFIVLKNKKTVW